MWARDAARSLLLASTGYRPRAAETRPLPRLVQALYDADRKGYSRSTTSLVQTMGRAARNLHGTVIPYAYRVTESMRRAIDETTRRRAVQHAYNVEYGIELRTIIRGIANPLLQLSNLDYHDAAFVAPKVGEIDVADEASLAKAISDLGREMKTAAKRLEFEQVVQLRDRIKELRAQQIYKT
jgi:excinuclease ABC subunit B